VFDQDRRVDPERDLAQLVEDAPHPLHGARQVLPQLGSVALQSGEHAGETIARRIAGKKTKPFAYKDKGTMATIGRGAAVVQMLGGRTMKGKAASMAWGTVHLALLPTNEDRAKAVVDWAGAGLTHQRSGRITVET
jgi:NADH dehydrogenase